jgi:hypothetical protein
MSPSESQLRAALQDGEGDAPDASLLISHALRVRRDRRRRVTSIAGGVAVVAVIGVGLTALFSSGTGGGNGGGGGSADSALGGAAAPAKVPADQAAGAASSAAGSSSGGSSAAKPGAFRATATGGLVDALKCPATPARYMLPGGGGSGQFGSGDPLFPDTVAAMKVCGYPQAAGAHPRTHVYDKPTSTRIVTTLNSARDTATNASCAVAHVVPGTIEILAVDSRGRTLKPVVITLRCRDSQATNGTAVRYIDAVPDELLALVQ